MSSVSVCGDPARCCVDLPGASAPSLVSAIIGEALRVIEGQRRTASPTPSKLLQNVVEGGRSGRAQD